MAWTAVFWRARLTHQGSQSGSAVSLRGVWEEASCAKAIPLGKSNSADTIKMETNIRVIAVMVAPPAKTWLGSAGNFSIPRSHFVTGCGYWQEEVLGDSESMGLRTSVGMFGLFKRSSQTDQTNPCLLSIFDIKVFASARSGSREKCGKRFGGNIRNAGLSAHSNAKIPARVTTMLSQKSDLCLGAQRNGQRGCEPKRRCFCDGPSALVGAVDEELRTLVFFSCIALAQGCRQIP